ncbi:hypothetical protein C8R45DRAFT_377566 [Mycena sanguinolenta]|nr:hypothetical protein C8R45DRAFT_377566 [Mycena sanguinolenta]
MTPTLPLELERSIVVDYVVGETTLRSCALTCGRLCYWAQSRLFHTINIGWDYKITQGPWMRRVARLLTVLDTSPHISSHIRVIHVERSFTALLAVLASRKWDMLDALHLHEIPRGDEDEYRALESLQQLISAPALRTLELAFDNLVWSRTYFRSLMSHCSSTITDLRLKNCHDDFGPHADVEYPLSDAASQPRLLPRIKRLGLIYAPAAVAALDELSCPLDLTHVRHLEYYVSRPTPHNSLGALLRRTGIRSNIHSLKVYPDDDDTLENLDFNFPSLRRIECRFTYDALSNLFPRISDGNRLTELTLTTFHDKWQADDDLDLETHSHHHRLGLQIDSILSEKFPSLRAVVVEVEICPRRSNHDRSIPRLNPAVVVRSIERSMPRLAEMGMVSVIILP